MGQLTVIFQGVCTHFRGVIRDVPHRVVLPDGSAFQFGMIDVGLSGTFQYFLMPHFATLRVPGASGRLEVPQVMEGGNIFGGVHIQILNTEGHGMVYGPNYDLIPRLTDYMPSYSSSDEVVLDGRAACYFDLHSGTIDKDLSSNAVTATVETDGAPTLVVSPFYPPGPPRTVIPLADDQDASVQLHVRNLGIFCDAGEVNYDFLLHYLTAKGGIPGIIAQPTPGMATRDGRIRPFTQDELDAAMFLLTTLDYPNRFQNPCVSPELRNPDLLSELSAPHTTIGETTLACSDSQYP